MDRENKIEASKSKPKGSKFDADIYKSAESLNFQLATRGPAVLFALGKASEKAGTDSNIVTAVGGMVLGSFGFFGNRYFRQKGDDSAYSYMGQALGAIQFLTGGMLLAAEAYKACDQGDSSPLLNVVKMASITLALTQSALILVNSYLYGGGPTGAVVSHKPSLP